MAVICSCILCDEPLTLESLTHAPVTLSPDKANSVPVRGRVAVARGMAAASVVPAAQNRIPLADISPSAPPLSSSTLQGPKISKTKEAPFSVVLNPDTKP